MLFLKLFALIYTSFRSVINERPLEVQHPRVAVLTHLQSGRLQSGSTDAADVFSEYSSLHELRKYVSEWWLVDIVFHVKHRNGVRDKLEEMHHKSRKGKLWKILAGEKYNKILHTSVLWKIIRTGNTNFCAAPTLGVEVLKLWVFSKVFLQCVLKC